MCTSPCWSWTVCRSVPTGQTTTLLSNAHSCSEVSCWDRNERSDQRGVWGLGPGTSGPLYVPGEYKKNRRKNKALAENQWILNEASWPTVDHVMFDNFSSCKLHTAQANVTTGIIKTSDLCSHVNSETEINVYCPQNKMQECATTVRKLRINGQRFLVSYSITFFIFYLLSQKILCPSSSFKFYESVLDNIVVVFVFGLLF